MTENKILDIFTDRVQIVNKPTHISESLTDHVHIMKYLIGEFFTNVTVKSIYFSDHDDERTVVEKNAVDLHTIAQNPI